MRMRSHPFTALACGLAACQLWLPLSLPAAATVSPEVEAEAPSLLKARFPDTAGYEWTETAIDRLSSMGIITGFPDGTFGPGKPVTRAEFAVMVSKAFDGKLSEPRTGRLFSDTSGHWAREQISKAYALGFISGYPDGGFRPEGNVTRVEAIVALASGLTLQGDSNLARYADAAQIPSWAVSNIKAATLNNIVIEGPNANQFRPAIPASRADIAVFIYQALQQLPAEAEIRALQPPQREGADPNPFIRLGSNPARFRDRMRSVADQLVVPAASTANIAFISALQNLIPTHFVQAGGPSTRGETTFWWPCQGEMGRLMMGWNNGRGSDVCETLALGGNMLPRAELLPPGAPIALSKQDSIGSGTVLVSPTSDQTTWAWLEITDSTIDVIVLGGAVLVDPQNVTKQLPGAATPQQVFALQRYILISDGTSGYMGQVIPLSDDERIALANSAEVIRFLDPNSWSPEMPPDLSQYQRYRDELLKGAEQTPQGDSIPSEQQPTLNELLQIWQQIFEQPGIFNPQRG